MKTLLTTVLLLTHLIAWSQMTVSKHAQLVYNNHSDEFFVLDDSTHFWTQKPGSQSWVKHAYIYAGDQPFQKMIISTRVLAMSENSYYFVHESCGNVYELIQDTLRRVDQSFPHQNQYDAPMIAWNKSVYMFGGYGFFQIKNTFSRYVPSTKEWFEVITKSAHAPSPRAAPLFIVDNNQFYMFGGYCVNKLKNSVLRDSWKYDFRTKKWKKLGEMNELLYKDFHNFKRNENQQNRVVQGLNRLIEMNVRQNTWTSYENPLFLNMWKIATSKDNKYILFLQSNSINDSRQVVVSSFESLKEFKVGTYPIYQKISVFASFPKDDYLWLSLILNFFLFTLLFYIRRMHKIKFLQRSSKVLKRMDFTPSEWELICLIHREGEMELSALNEYFNEEGLSYETLKKRRETFIKNIRIKIALLTRVSIEGILVETKHKVDKRMKMINWNEDIELEYQSEQD